MEHCQVGMVLSNTYELLSKLGQGGMGEVWVARHVRLPEKPVAVKVIYHSDENLLERLRREARVMAGLNHPHIAHIIDLDALPNGHPFMVMELLSGAPLSEKISKGHYVTQDIDEWIYQLGDALKSAHSHGIIHRDLKPDNLFLCDDHSLKVLDFGLSKIAHMDRLSMTGALLGTPYYMSPEQVNGEEVDERSDLFALGLICIELITKQRPITGNSLPKIFKSIREYSLPDCPSDFEPDRWSLIKYAIAQDPNERMASVTEWVEAFIDRRLPHRRLNHALINQSDVYPPSLNQTIADEENQDIFAETVSSDPINCLEDTVHADHTVQDQAKKNQQTGPSIPSFDHGLSSQTLGSNQDQHLSKQGLAQTLEHSENYAVEALDAKKYGHPRLKLILGSLFIIGVIVFYLNRTRQTNRQSLPNPTAHSVVQSQIPYPSQTQQDSGTRPLESKQHNPTLSTEAENTLTIKVSLPPNYQVAIEQAKSLGEFKHWAPLLLLKEQLKRFPTQQYVPTVQKALVSLEQKRFFEFEQTMKEVLFTLGPQEDQVRKYTQALLTLSYCQSNAFKAYQSYQKMAEAEQALVDSGIGKCKSKFFKIRRP